jgi:hypothetical protein
MSETTTTEYGRLLAALATCRWDHMRVLADAAEDAGDPELAAGWRWLATRRKWPNDYGWRHSWFLTAPRECVSRDDDRLPDSDAYDDPPRDGFVLVTDALEWGARAVGRWLATRKRKAKAK